MYISLTHLHTHILGIARDETDIYRASHFSQSRRRVALKFNRACKRGDDCCKLLSLSTLAYTHCLLYTRVYTNFPGYIRSILSLYFSLPALEVFFADYTDLVCVYTCRVDSVSPNRLLTPEGVYPGLTARQDLPIFSRCCCFSNGCALARERERSFVLIGPRRIAA